ncbi:caspase 9 inhibitor [Ectromelia virus]|nr:caspase 9 inhibitor [Ectromelia virus]
MDNSMLSMFMYNIVDNGIVQDIDNGIVQDIDNGIVQDIDNGIVQDIDNGIVQDIDNGIVQDIDNGIVQDIDNGIVQDIDNGIVQDIDNGIVQDIDNGIVQDIDNGIVQDIDNGIVQDIDNGIVQDIDNGIVQDIDNGIVQDIDNGIVQDIDNGIVQDIDNGIVQDIEDKASDNDDHNYVYPLPENMVYRFDKSTNILDYLSTERDHVMMAVQYYMGKQRLDDLYRQLPTKTRSYIDIINMYCDKVNNDYSRDINIMCDDIAASTESFTVYDINNKVNTILMDNKGLGVRLITISFITKLGRRCMNPVETIKMFTLLSHTICDDYFVDYITDIFSTPRDNATTSTREYLKLMGIAVIMFATYKTLKYMI